MCYGSMPFSWFSCLVSECFGCHYVACAFVACAHHSRVLIKLAVVALGGGPQPGGVEHPPNPRGWLLGECKRLLRSTHGARTQEHSGILSGSGRRSVISYVH